MNSGVGGTEVPPTNPAPGYTAVLGWLPAAGMIAGGLKVVVRDQEEFEQALREFRRKVQEQGLVREMRRRAHYVPPAEARKMKSLRARRHRSR